MFIATKEFFGIVCGYIMFYEDENKNTFFKVKT